MIKRLFISAILLCARIFAVCSSPNSIEVTGPLNTLSSTMNGTIILQLGYTVESTPPVQQSQIQLRVAAGSIYQGSNAYVCLPPSTSITANYSVQNPFPLTGATQFYRYWSIPASGGPYTVQTIEGSTPVTPLTSVPLSWLAQSGAGTGALVYWNGTSWIPTPGILDANINTGAKIGGGGPATDNTAAINSWFATATSTQNAVLTLSGATVGTGFLIPPTNGNITILGCGTQCGFYIKSGSNAFGITNSTSSTPTWVPFEPAQFPVLSPSTPAITNTGSVILDSFTVNGNRGTEGMTNGNVSGTLAVPYGNASGNCPGSFSPGPEKGYCTLGPPNTPNIGSGIFPSSPSTGQWALITNGSTGLDCSTRGGTLKVFCYWNGSAWAPGGGGANGGSFAWYNNIDLNSLNYVRINNVLSLDSPFFAVRLGNVNNVEIDTLTCSQSGSGTDENHDCAHIDGPASNITIKNVVCVNIDDDCVALNANEGFQGNIVNAVINGVTLSGMNQGDFVNIGGQTGAYVENVLISNLQGTGSTAAGLRVEGGSGKVAGTIQLSDSNIGANGFLNDIATGTITKMLITNSSLTPTGGSALAGCNSGSTIGDLEIDNTTIVMSSGVSPDYEAVIVGTGCTVQKLTLGGLSLTNASGSSYGLTNALQLDGTVNELVINAFSPIWFTNFVNSSSGWRNVSRVSGTGLVSMGFPIPDAIVVNGVPFISSDLANNPVVIKIGGTVGGVDGTAVAIAILGYPNSGSFILPTGGTLSWNGRTQIVSNCNGCLGLADNALSNLVDFNAAAASYSSGFGWATSGACTSATCVLGKASFGSVEIGSTGSPSTGAVSFATGAGMAHYYCQVHDQTTPAQNNLMTCTATSSGITITTSSAWAASDVLVWWTAGSN